MIKITFQKKQAVIKNFLIFLIIGSVSNLKAQTTLLTVGSSGSLTINSGGTLNVSGLELNPSTDYTINETQVSKELTNVALVSGIPTTMGKVYSIDADIENFLGTITFNYVESEMDEITHDASMYVFDTESSAWAEYLDSDTAEFKVTSTFESPLQINMVTVGTPNSLSVESEIANGIRIYPNPSSSILNVEYSEDLQLSLFNLLGQLVMSSNSKSINISNLDQGTYILSAKDSNNNINNFKIIKR